MEFDGSPTASDSSSPEPEAQGEGNLALLCRAAFEFASTSSPLLVGSAATVPPLQADEGEGAGAGSGGGATRDAAKAARLAPISEPAVGSAGREAVSWGRAGGVGVSHLPSVATWYQLPNLAVSFGAGHGHGGGRGGGGGGVRGEGHMSRAAMAEEAGRSLQGMQGVELHCGGGSSSCSGGGGGGGADTASSSTPEIGPRGSAAGAASVVGGGDDAAASVQRSLGADHDAQNAERIGNARMYACARVCARVRKYIHTGARAPAIDSFEGHARIFLSVVCRPKHQPLHPRVHVRKF